MESQRTRRLDDSLTAFAVQAVVGVAISVIVAATMWNEISAYQGSSMTVAAAFEWILLVLVGTFVLAWIWMFGASLPVYAAWWFSRDKPTPAAAVILGGGSALSLGMLAVLYFVRLLPSEIDLALKWTIGVGGFVVALAPLPWAVRDLRRGPKDPPERLSRRQIVTGVIAASLVLLVLAMWLTT